MRKQFFLFPILTLILALFPVTSQALTCNEIFPQKEVSLSLETALNKIKDINPELIFPFESLPPHSKSFLELYKILKIEVWKLLPNGIVPWKSNLELPEEILINLQSNLSKNYDLSTATKKELYIFYVNWLQAQMIRVSQFIRSDFLQSIHEFPLERPTKEFLEGVYDRLLVVDPGRTESPPQLVFEAFEQTLVEMIHWNHFSRIANDYFKEKPNQFHLWLENHPLWQTLSESEQKLFIAQLHRKPDRKRNCCLSSPGCLFCPNNRGFLKK